MTLQPLIAQLREEQSIRALAKLITQVENSDEAMAEIVRNLHQHTGRAQIVGVTGPPGAGKSSLVTEIAKALRHQHHLRLGIVAVDPSSPFTGGALLGDRIRMRDLSGDKGVFIRSMASRGSLGGLAQATSAVAKLLDAAGFDLILIETVGAGQSEVEIAQLAHTTIVVEAPGMGDDVQSIKAGILEIADILVVNKADKPGALQTVKGLEMMLHLGPAGGTRHHGRVDNAPEVVQEKEATAWQIPVCQTSALEGTGVPELVQQILAHKTHLQQTGQWHEREVQRSQRELQHLLYQQFWKKFHQTVPAGVTQEVAEAVASRQLDPYTAVDQLFAHLEGQKTAG